MIDLGGLLGAEAGRVRERLGDPTVERRVGNGRWLVYAGEGVEVRLRTAQAAGDEGDERVRSWTANFDPAPPSLAAACSALGIEPDPPRPGDARAEPEDASGAAPRGLRRGLTDPRTGRIDSLTARTVGRRIRSVTAFDEAPEWR